MSSSSASSFVPNVPHGSTGDIILGVYLPITVISFLFVAIRLYTRVILCRFAGADDSESIIRLLFTLRSLQVTSSTNASLVLIAVAWVLRLFLLSSGPPANMKSIAPFFWHSRLCSV